MVETVPQRAREGKNEGETLRAQERIGFPDLLDQLPPLGRRDATWLVGRNVDHLNGLACGPGGLGRRFSRWPRILFEYPTSPRLRRASQP